MQIPTLHLDQLLAAAVFIGARVSGLMIFCPFLGSSAIPAQIRAGLTLAITALLYFVHGPVAVAVTGWEWAGTALTEMVIGLVLGLSANLMLEAVLVAGQLLGMQMGYALASLFDPQTQADTPVLAQFHRMAALLIFLATDVHHWLLRAIVRSFVYLPPGTAMSNFALPVGLLRSGSAIFLVGAQIAAPALLATLVADVALGFLGKASPAMPVMFIGMAVKNLLGMCVLLAVIAYWPQSVSAAFVQAVARGERLLYLAR